MSAFIRAEGRAEGRAKGRAKGRASLVPQQNALAAQTAALRRVFALTLYAVDCFRLVEARLATQVPGMWDGMEALADMQECIAAQFPGDNTLGD